MDRRRCAGAASGPFLPCPPGGGDIALLDQRQQEQSLDPRIGAAVAGWLVGQESGEQRRRQLAARGRFGNGGIERRIGAQDLRQFGDVFRRPRCLDPLLGERSDQLRFQSEQGHELRCEQVELAPGGVDLHQGHPREPGTRPAVLGLGQQGDCPVLVAFEQCRVAQPVEWLVGKRHAGCELSDCSDVFRRHLLARGKALFGQRKVTARRGR